jgi:hypothetical protein
MIKFYGSLLMVVFLAMGCGSSSTAPGKMERVNGNPVLLNLLDSNRQNRYLEELLTPVACFQLQVPEQEALAAVDQVLVYKNQFICADKKFSSLLVFDTGGRFIKRIGKIGKGAGKYLSIEDVFIDTPAGKLTVFSNTSTELISFNLDDDKTENMPLKFNGWRCVPVENDRIAFYLNFLGIINNPHNFFLTDNKGNILREDLEYSSMIKSGFEMSGGITPSGNGYLINSAFSDTVYYGTAKTFQPAYVFGIGPSKVPVEAMINTSLFMSPGTDYSYAGSRMVDLPGALFFNYTYRLGENFAIYHKREKQLYTSITLKRSPLSALFFTPVGKTADGAVISVISPSLFPYFEKEFPLFKKVLAEKFPALQSLLSNSLNKTNPILIVFRLKE